MSSVINTNALSLVTQNNLNKSQGALNSAIQRLSSGLRINSAKDDAAGQAIANRFTANIKALTQAQRNANDGISLAQTTEGALSEVNTNLQRIRELTVQSASGTNSAADKASIQSEISQRLSEIDRTSAQTDFNGVKVLANNTKLSVQVGAKDGERIDIDLKQIDSSSLKLNSLTVAHNELKVGAKITSVVDATAGTGSAAVNFAAGSVTSLNTATGGNFTAADLSLHEVQDSSGNGTGNFVVKAGDTFYAASVDRTSGSGVVTLNTADVDFTDHGLCDRARQELRGRRFVHRGLGRWHRHAERDRHHHRAERQDRWHDHRRIQRRGHGQPPGQDRCGLEDGGRPARLPGRGAEPF